jgi:YbbR domain-containing protein
VFGANGVLEGITPSKGYIDMSTVDEETSKQISAAVTAKGGRFLEVSPRKRIRLRIAIDDSTIIVPAFTTEAEQSAFADDMSCQHADDSQILSQA